MRFSESSAKRNRPNPVRGLSESKDSLAVDLGTAAHRAGEADEAGTRRAGLDRHEGAGEGPDRRYETANGFAADIERYLADEPVQACPPSASYRVSKFARRNKAALAVTSLVLFSLMLLGAGIGWVMRDRTERQTKVAGQVELILNEVEELQNQQKWREALAAGRRAEVALTSGEPDFTTEQRVRERLKELEFVDRLERIRMQSEIDAETDRKYVAGLSRLWGGNRSVGRRGVDQAFQSPLESRHPNRCGPRQLGLLFT